MPLKIWNKKPTVSTDTIKREEVGNNKGDAINMVEEVMKALFTKKGTIRKKWQSKEDV